MKRGKEKASSSSKAAARAQGGDVGVGFGGFLGSQALTPAASGGNGQAAAPVGDLDAELAQHLKRLTKRDAITRLKALQALRSLLQQRDDAEVQAVLPSWAHAYPRLVQDNDRAVRLEAAEVMGMLGGRAGRKLAPFLRVLLPPWWASCFDSHSEVSSAAKAAVQAVFPGPKQRDALLFCRAEVLTLLEENLASEPADLGDPSKESKEELADRHQRVLSASLLALGAVADAVETLPPPPPAHCNDAAQPSGSLSDTHAAAAAAADVAGTHQPGAAAAAATADAQGPETLATVPESGGIRRAAADGGEEELFRKVAAVVQDSGFWKRQLGSKSAPVRRAAYSFTAQLCRRHPQMVGSSLAASAPLVLGCMQDKYAPNHGVMWEMVLTYCRTFPQSWDHVDAQMVVLPRLTSFLSHTCYGSFETSFPALLPFLSCIPAGLWLAAPHQAAAVAATLWKGCASLTTQAARSIGASCYQECYCFLLACTTSAAPEGEASVRSSGAALLHSALCDGPVTAAISAPIAGTADMGNRAVVGVVHSLSSRQHGSGSDDLPQLLAAVGKAAATALSKSLEQAVQQEGESSMTCKRLTALLNGLANVNGGKSREVVAACVVAPTAQPLVAAVSGGRASAQHSTLLASLIHSFGSGIAVSVTGTSEGDAASSAEAGESLDADALAERALNGSVPLEGLPAQADLLAACLQQGSHPEAACSPVLLRLAGIDPPVTDGTKRAKGLEMAALLVDRLSAQASNTSIWHSDAVDRLSAFLVEPDLLLLPAAAKLGALLLHGNGPQPLVRQEAAVGLLSALGAHLRHFSSGPGGNATSAAAAASLRLLDGCLYSMALCASPELAAQQAALLSCVMQLAWRSAAVARGADTAEYASSSDAASLASVGEDAGDEDADGGPDEDLQPAERHVSPAEVFMLAKQVWAAGEKLAALLQMAPTDTATGLGRQLSSQLIQGVHDAAADQQDVQWVTTWANHTEELFCALEFEPDVADELVSALLAPQQSWPRFAAHAAAAQAEEREGHQLSVTAVEALAVALSQKLGVAAVFGTDSSHTRMWILEELLCSAHAPRSGAASGGVTPDAANALLCDCLLEATTSDATSFLDGLLDRMWSGCCKGDSSAVAVHSAATRAVLQHLVQHAASDTNQTAAAAAAAGITGLVRRRLTGPPDTQLPRQLLQNFVGILAPFLRSDSSGSRLQSAGFPDFAVAACKAAVALPPVAVCAAENRPQTDAALAAVQLAVACFPASADDAAVTARPEEQAALLVLLQRQVAGERAALTARLAEQRLQPAPAAAPAASEGEMQAQAAVTQLSLSCLAYCWQDLGEKEWDAIFKRTQAGLSAACVALEDVAEAVSSAAVSATAAASNSQQDSVEAAVLLLHKLGRLTLLDDPPAPPVAAAIRNSGIGDWQRDQHQDHVAIFALLAKIFEGVDRPTAAPSSWPDFAGEAIADALRMFFVSGTVQSLAMAAGSQAVAEAQRWRAQASSMWAAVAAVTLMAAKSNSSHLQQPIRDAIHAQDAWSADIGVDAVAALLALLLAPEADLQAGKGGLPAAALQLLLTPGLDLLSRLSSAPVITEEEAALAEEAAEEVDAAQDAVSRLAAVGVRPELAAALGGGRQGRGFLYAAALMAGHLLALRPGSAGRRLLAQTLRDIHSLVPEMLDSALDTLALPAASTSAAQRRNGSAGAGASPLTAATMADVAGTGSWQYVDDLRASGASSPEASAEALAAAAYRGVMLALPASTAVWFSDLRDRGVAAAVEAYTRNQHSPVLLAHELAVIQSPAAKELASAENFSLKANSMMREVVAVAEVEDGAVLELVIRLPTSWPLKPAEVDCRRKVGVTEGRLRKWLLSISSFLRNQNGSILDAMSLWKANVDQAFEGVEECLICYNIVHAGNGALPRMTCRTCAKKFHSTCLYKWFASSAKSNCPHCQSQWLHSGR